MVAYDLDTLRQVSANSCTDVEERLRTIWNEISELASDLHSLSHRLHSSTLESLGLVAGVRAFCREFEEQQGVEVEFFEENMPSKVPSDAALCLFRVTQEALRNVKRHSGANRAQVKLQWTEGQLHLTISDSGKGFDSNRRSHVSGIGVRSMEERLRLVGGRLNLYSEPSKGTRIEACIPIRVASQVAS
jgi:signal transduction histidine kinase